MRVHPLHTYIGRFAFVLFCFEGCNPDQLCRPGGSVGIIARSPRLSWVRIPPRAALNFFAKSFPVVACIPFLTWLLHLTGSL